jgi:hypothetical protein
MEMLIRRLVSALVLAGAAFCGRGADASTIYTYTFTQNYDSFGFAATVTGGFTGTAALGYINLSTLSEFHLEYSSTNYLWTYAGLPNDFSFGIGGPSGTSLTFRSPIFPGEICVGWAVSFLCNGGTSLGIFTTGGVAVARSTVEPVVTLVSAINETPVATTPIPGAMVLFATALGGLCAAGAWRRKAARTASA